MTRQERRDREQERLDLERRHLDLLAALTGLREQVSKLAGEIAAALKVA
jgi:hypothetical protein